MARDGLEDMRILLDAMALVLLENTNGFQLGMILLIVLLLLFLVWGHILGFFTCAICMDVLIPIVNVVAIWWILKAKRRLEQK